MPSTPPRTRRARLDALLRPVDGAGLAVARMAFGAIVVWEVLRYYERGWIERYYVDAPLQFTYLVAPWLRPLPAEGMQVAFALLGVAGGLLAIGLWTRTSAAVTAVLLSYAFLLEQSRYLNHGYLMCLLALLFVVLPTHRTWSVDAWRHGRDRPVPAWTYVTLRVQVGLVYAFAGIAKVAPDWLAGRPLDLWLQGHGDLPLIGPLTEWVHGPLLFAYGGLLLDLLAFPALLWRPTRLPMFLAIVAFHVGNFQLFDIGVFPVLATSVTTVFFSPSWPRALVARTAGVAARRVRSRTPGTRERWALVLLAAYGAVQLALPLRHHLYPSDVAWSEEGHRFAWRMMLRSKTGDLRLVVVDPSSGEHRVLDARDLVASWQYGQVSTRPDLVQQLAHHVARREAEAGRPGVAVHALAFVALNGRAPAMLIDPRVDLAVTPRSWRAAAWVLPAPP